ncbi:MAG: 3-hydroxyacyl-ACP dehydratase FabZ, partial [Verrucomicrobiia bacterium]
VEQDAERDYFVVTEPVFYQNGEVQLTILPCEELRITMTIDFNHVAIGVQHATFTLTSDTFTNELSSARTFCFLREVKELQDKGLIRGGTLENAVVVGDESILNDDLRYQDEMVRHKILDLFGDIFLIGKPIKGHVIAVKSGHATHVEFTKKIRQAHNGSVAKEITVPATSDLPEFPLTVNDIKKIIPHRYPFLLVDRITHYEPGVSVLGLKNVTNNEPFFQGHWPDNPVMPGVLIVEALAQVTSMVIFGPEGPEKDRRAYFMGIDNCKFRKIVVPGDQLILEATIIKLRRNASRVRGIARVDGKVVAEAEMMFILR